MGVRPGVSPSARATVFPPAIPRPAAAVKAKSSAPTKLWAAIFWTAILFVYTYTLWLMLRIVLQYTSLRPDVAFLEIKQDYIDIPGYRLAFFTHVFSSGFVLLAAYSQFSAKLRRIPGLHKWLGRLYAYIVIFLAGPTGLFIGFFANGGISSRIAFCLLAVLWVSFTILALLKMRARQVQDHARWMVRSYALALSAITLRAWKVAIIALFHPHPMDVYRIVAWLGWVGNLIAAELLILYLFRRRARPTPKTRAQLLPTEVHL